MLATAKSITVNIGYDTEFNRKPGDGEHKNGFKYEKKKN